MPDEREPNRSLLTQPLKVNELDVTNEAKFGIRFKSSWDSREESSVSARLKGVADETALERKVFLRLISKRPESV